MLAVDFRAPADTLQLTPANDVARLPGCVIGDDKGCRDRLATWTVAVLGARKVEWAKSPVGPMWLCLIDGSGWICDVLRALFPTADFRVVQVMPVRGGR